VRALHDHLGSIVACVTAVHDFANRKPRLLYLVSEDWYFCSHRLPLAVAARSSGFEVTVATRVSSYAEQIRSAGLALEPIALARYGHNPWRELHSLAQIIGIYRRVRPDLAHHVAVKPVLYGSIAARMAHTPAVVNAIAGLGYVVSSSDLRARVLRPAIHSAYRLLLNRHGSRLIVQNPDDVAALTQNRLVDPGRVVMIRGSGVDTAHFAVAPEPAGVCLVVLPARLLRYKGVIEFVEAARALRAQGVQARFALVGESDPGHPAEIRQSEIERWCEEGTVEYWGWRDDMCAVFQQAHVVCLPSYREGLPKALIEAAACGRAIVTCDVPGCREVVRDGDNGLLVPPHTVEPLAQALRRVIEDAALRRRMGARGRERAVAEFSVDKVIADTLAVYRAALAL
jgi:glycosyltransferase involved in cell wall biosynthesis